MTDHIRHGAGSVRPYLCGPVELLNFIETVFDAEEVERHEFGPESFHVEYRVGDSVLVVEAGELGPDQSSWTNSIYVYLPDVDEAYRRAIQLGATSIASPTEKPYDERQAGVKDMAGNTWWLSTFASS